MQFAIVRNDDVKIVHTYESDFKKDSDLYFGYLSCPPLCTHVEVPIEMQGKTLEAYMNDAGCVEVRLAAVQIDSKPWWKLW